MVRCESRSSTIGHITLGTKQTGAPSAGNPHAGCDAAGAGNGFTVWLMRHSQRKRGATARLDLRNTAPVLDPTGFSNVFLTSGEFRVYHRQSVSNPVLGLSGGLHESGQANRRTCNGSVPAFEGLSSTVIDGIVEDEMPGAIKSVIQLGAL
jgi:hypothetical protein